VLMWSRIAGVGGEAGLTEAASNVGEGVAG
jgi:hypothetical protein